MRLLRSALCASALMTASALPGLAADAPAPLVQGETCDLFCDVGAYLNRDHMVAFVPADPQAAPAPSPLKKPAKKVVTPVRHAVAMRHVLPKSVQAIAAPPQSEPPPRQTAQLAPPAPAPDRPTEALAKPLSAAIPGSAPLVRSQFDPPSGAL